MYFLDHNMKWYKMIEIYLKYDNMHTFGIINAFNCINNHVNSCINSMLSQNLMGFSSIMGRICMQWSSTNTEWRDDVGCKVTCTKHPDAKKWLVLFTVMKCNQWDGSTTNDLWN